MKKILHAIVALIGTIVFLGLDLWTKQVFFISPFISAKFNWLNGLIQHVDHKNFGITANIPIPQPITILVTVAAVSFFSYEKFRAIRDKKIHASFFLVLLIAGALGNLYDRVALGFVRDWILLFHRSAINLADFFIGIGLLGWIIMKTKNQRQNT
jgi:signal peptidase II